MFFPGAFGPQLVSVRSITMTDSSRPASALADPKLTEQAAKGASRPELAVQGRPSL